MGTYYDGTKLLSLKDINGDTPEIYMCVGNRTAGKTTFFNRLMINKFKRDGSKFCLLYRYNYDLENCAESFFKDIKHLFFPNDDFSSVKCGRGMYTELYLNDKHCGYAITLNSADHIKKRGHLFSDISCFLFDEFQSETNHYCDDEITKFQSIHTTVARGGGNMYRPVPVYMLSNSVSLINPYYTAFGLSTRIRSDTKFIKSAGLVMEQTMNENAKNAQQASAFNRAFASNDYLDYSSQNIYLKDSLTFIDRPNGRSSYVCTLKYKGNHFAIREYLDAGYLYCDDRWDSSFPRKIAITTNDHNINYVMLKKNDFVLANFRFLFERGCFRFKNLICKEALMTAISY